MGGGPRVRRAMRGALPGEPEPGAARSAGECLLGSSSTSDQPPPPRRGLSPSPDLLWEPHKIRLRLHDFRLPRPSLGPCSDAGWGFRRERETGGRGGGPHCGHSFGTSLFTQTEQQPQVGASCLPASRSQRAPSADPRDQACPGSTQRVPSCISTSRNRGRGAQAGSARRTSVGFTGGYCHLSSVGCTAGTIQDVQKTQAHPTGFTVQPDAPAAPAANACETCAESARWAPPCSFHKLCEKVEEKPHPDTQFCLCTILNQSNLAKGQTTPQGQEGKRGLRRRKKVITSRGPRKDSATLHHGQDQGPRGAGPQVRPSRGLPGGLEPPRKPASPATRGSPARQGLRLHLRLPRWDEGGC